MCGEAGRQGGRHAGDALPRCREKQLPSACLTNAATMAKPLCLPACLHAHAVAAARAYHHRAHHCGTIVTPSPNASAQLMMKRLRRVSASPIIRILTPLMTTAANRKLVAPPKTQCGMVNTSPPNLPAPAAGGSSVRPSGGLAAALLQCKSYSGLTEQSKEQQPASGRPASPP